MCCSLFGESEDQSSGIMTILARILTDAENATAKAAKPSKDAQIMNFCSNVCLNYVLCL